MSPANERSNRHPWVPIALGLAMALLIGFSVLQSFTGNSTAIPAPSQYTTPPTSQSAFSSPLVIGGIALVVIIVLALLFLFFRGRGGPSAGRGSSKKSTGGGEGAEAETATSTAGGAGASSFSEDEGTGSPAREGGAGEWTEGNEPKEGDLDSTLSELDELAKTSDEQMPSSEKE